MKAATLVPVEEYLRTTYEPDCDYVDGEVLERNVGERDHSRLQRELILYFGTRAKKLNIQVFPEQRVQISSRRFWIPDICVIAGTEPEAQVFSNPPLICIEILSRDDRQDRMQEKIDDFLNFGVRYVWVINPRNRRAWAYTTDGSREVKDGVLRTTNPDFEIKIAELFPE
jgi:Uma2 family endonuclease